MVATCDMLRSCCRTVPYMTSRWRCDLDAVIFSNVRHTGHLETGTVCPTGQADQSSLYPDAMMRGSTSLYTPAGGRYVAAAAYAAPGVAWPVHLPYGNSS